MGWVACRQRPSHSIFTFGFWLARHMSCRAPHLHFATCPPPPQNLWLGWGGLEYNVYLLTAKLGPAPTPDVVR
eukprot:scaffold13643_cov110-Isochrysis_galbana.AAC.6